MQLPECILAKEKLFSQAVTQWPSPAGCSCAEVWCASYDLVLVFRRPRRSEDSLASDKHVVSWLTTASPLTPAEPSSCLGADTNHPLFWEHGILRQRLLLCPVEEELLKKRENFAWWRRIGETQSRAASMNSWNMVPGPKSREGVSAALMTLTPRSTDISGSVRC